MAIKSSNHVWSFPWSYTYLSRIGGARAAAGYFLLEIFPLLSITFLLNRRLIIETLLLFAMGISFYELGYFYNDHRDVSALNEEKRLKGIKISIPVFLVSHCIAIAVLAALLRAVTGSYQVPGKSIIANLAILALLLLHSSSSLRAIRYGRIGTFIALAFYKYCVVLIPLFGYRITLCALIGMFLFCGVARSIVYSLRKFGNLTQPLDSKTQDRIQRGLLIIAGPVIILLIEFGERSLYARLTITLWCVYSLSSLLIWAAGRFAPNIGKAGRP